ncbi:DNA-directed RNA polymerase III subunit RPC7-like [Onthophagus taurus]|uniref:DNA-directed RNA polymerase III subunit RPC7-like n=1 Tax=Onthophagus taurus TaxID=166361 RepID=UPI000C205416|nr:DNA-directed RNA polymerase III subunit RPC7 [Onthophagus taurus]XP_022899668.1 DNA-directed RNA polymerase III subunit RPC7 [Onthophagus taurus]
MAGRGRGRGGRGGNSKSFSRDQLASIGAGTNDLIPGPVTQPPPLYPPLNRQPVPVQPSEDLDYLLTLRQDIIDHMYLSTAFLRVSKTKVTKSDHEIDKLLAQLPSATNNFDWELFPTELRPKMSAKRIKKQVKKEVDVEDRLNRLEKLENDTDNVAVKEEVEDEDVENEEIFDDADEEMDEGTDYANNYFDNGEAFDEEDDNLDDGPVY